MPRPRKTPAVKAAPAKSQTPAKKQTPVKRVAQKITTSSKLASLDGAVVLCVQSIISADGKIEVPKPTHTGGIESKQHKGAKRRPPLYPWTVDLWGPHADAVLASRDSSAWETLSDGTHRIYCEHQQHANAIRGEITGGASTNDQQVVAQVNFADKVKRRLVDAVRSDLAAEVSNGLVALPAGEWTVTVTRDDLGAITAVTLTPARPIG